MTLEDLAETIRIEGTSTSTILPDREKYQWCSWVRIVLAFSGEWVNLYLFYVPYICIIPTLL